MSILLSDAELDKHYSTTWQEFDIGGVLKAAAIHAVQYLEGECTEHSHRTIYLPHIGDSIIFNQRKDCPKCREKYHKELGL
jgi:hypothetical protein